MRHEVCQALICELRAEGKSDPLSTTQEMFLDLGGGEKNLAPRAA
jgi:hypothetical protein